MCTIRFFAVFLSGNNQILETTLLLSTWFRRSPCLCPETVTYIVISIHYDSFNETYFILSYQWSELTVFEVGRFLSGLAWGRFDPVGTLAAGLPNVRALQHFQCSLRESSGVQRRCMVLHVIVCFWMITPLNKCLLTITEQVFTDHH